MRLTQDDSILKNTYILLRHGQTEGNIKKVYMGRKLDLGLNEIGTTQARQVTLPLIPDLIFFSPAKRTYQTAAIVNERLDVKDVMSDARLLEKAGGDIDGMPYDEIARRYPESWNSREAGALKDIASIKFPNGESDLDVADRMRSLFAELEDRYAKKTILLVTHAGVIQATRYLFGKPKEAVYEPVANCSTDMY